MLLPHRNQSVDLQSKATDWFLYDGNIGRERVNKLTALRDRCQISLLILSKFKQINQLRFPLKSSENLWFPDEFRDRS